MWCSLVSWQGILHSSSAAFCPKSWSILKLPRPCTQRATLTACLLALVGCRVGGVNAIAPLESEQDDDGEISVSESPALGNRDASIARDAASDMDPDPDADHDSDSDAGASGDASACASDTGLCSELPEGCISERFGEHVYVFCGAELPWSAARTSCLDLGLDLVIIEDAEENAFVAAHLLATSWLGANDQHTEGSFVWVTPGVSADGAAITYTNWSLAVPDNCGGLFGQQDCVRLAADGHWDDSDCNGGCLEGAFAFVCESF
jgi:hypothetical protein